MCCTPYRRKEDITMSMEDVRKMRCLYRSGDVVSDVCDRCGKIMKGNVHWEPIYEEVDKVTVIIGYDILCDACYFKENDLGSDVEGWEK